MSVYLTILFYLIAAPLSLLLHFYFAVWRMRCPCSCLPSELSCTTYMVVFFSLLRKMCILPYAYYMWLPFVYFAPVCLLFVDLSSGSHSGKGVLCRLLSHPLPPLCLPCLFVLFCFLRPCSFPVCFWFNSVYLVAAVAGFVAD